MSNKWPVAADELVSVPGHGRAGGLALRVKVPVAATSVTTTLALRVGALHP